jgi:hypothetical protein
MQRNTSSEQVFVVAAVRGRIEAAAYDERDLVPVAVNWEGRWNHKVENAP